MISINDLHKEIENRENKKIKIYKQMLEKCYKLIISTNKMNNNCCCIYKLSAITFGVPLYDVGECILYIMKDLNKRGFKIEHLPPNSIYIDWKVKPKTEPNINRYQLTAPKKQKPSIYHSTDLNSIEFSNIFDV